jgi:hypothetical protein
MPLANVFIELVRDGLGLVAGTNDNTCGIILAGTAVPDKLELNKAYPVYSIADAKNLGITLDGNAGAYRQVSEFYATAGTGKKLWLLVAADTATLSDHVDQALEPCVAKTLLDAAGGEIVALGLTAQADAGATLDGLDSAVYSAMLKAQLLANDYQAKMMPYITVIEGRKFTGAADGLRNLSTETNYRTCITLGSSLADGSASVGMLLGMIAAHPVQRKISRIKNGALPVESKSGYLSDGILVDNRGDLDTINDKRFIIFRKFPNKSGYYYNGDFTATALTDDLNGIARIRTIDKAMKIAYNTYVEELDDDVDVNSDGTLDASVAAYLKEKIEEQVNGAMTGEISGFVANIDTTIDILSGLPQAIYLDITPKGYLNPIRVILGYKNN